MALNATFDIKKYTSLHTFYIWTEIQKEKKGILEGNVTS